jgi:hypothetical protein
MEEMRMTNTAETQTDLFVLLVGEDKMNNVVLLTSFWEGDYEKKAKREVELLRDYWGEMRRKGAGYARFSLADFKPAMASLLNLLQKRAIVPNVVEQLAQGKTFAETDLGKEANKELEKVKAEAAEARQQLEEMKKTMSATMHKMLDDQKRQFDQTIADVLAKQKEMGVRGDARNPGQWQATVSYQNVDLVDHYRRGNPYRLFSNSEGKCFVEFLTPTSGDLTLKLNHCCTTSDGVIDITVNGRDLYPQYRGAPRLNFGLQEFLIPRSFLLPSGSRNQLTIKLWVGSPAVYWLSDVEMRC